MARIVKKDFTLNRAGVLTSFKVGDTIDGEDADHWFAQAHSEEIPVVEAKAEPVTEAEPIAEKKSRNKAAKAETADQTEGEQQ